MGCSTLEQTKRETKMKGKQGIKTMQNMLDGEKQQCDCRCFCCYNNIEILLICPTLIIVLLKNKFDLMWGLAPNRWRYQIPIINCILFLIIMIIGNEILF